MPRHINTTAWVLLALTAASIEPVLVKLGFALAATPLQLLIFKNIVGAIVMLLLVRGWRRPTQTRLNDIVIVSLLLMSTNALIIMALTKLSAVELITIITCTPLMVALVNYNRRRDNHGHLFWFGLGTAITGVLLSLQIGTFSLNCLGTALALAAVLSSTTYRVRIESILSKADPTIVSLNIFVINGLIAGCCLPFIGPVTNFALIAPYTLWMGIAGALANLAFIAAIKELGATRMSVINLVQRPLVVLIAAVALKEALSWPQILGFALVMVGVQMAQVKPVKSIAIPNTGAELPLKALSLSGK